MMEMADEFSNENAELSSQIRHLDDQVKKYADCSGRRATQKLQRNINIIERLMLRRRFKQWADGAIYLNSIDTAGFICTKLLKRRWVGNMFKRWKKQVANVKREEYIFGRLDWHFAQDD